MYVSVTVTKEAVYAPKREQDLFSMSRNTIHKVTELADEVRCEVLAPIEAGETEFRHAKESALHHLWKNVFRYPVQTYENCAEKELEIYAGTDAKAECRYAVTKMLGLIQNEGYRYRDIAVMVSDINRYGELMEQELSCAGLPSFLDYKKNMSENTVASYLKAVLSLTETGLHTEGLLNYAKNALSGYDSEQVWDLENYCLALGIRGTQFKTEWKKQYRTKTETDLERLNEIRKQLTEDVMPLMEVFQKKDATVEEWTRELFYFLRKHGIEERIKEKSEIL